MSSISDESPANILVFWREDILDLSMIEANAQFNSFLPMLRSNLKILRYAPFLFTQAVKLLIGETRGMNLEK